MRFVALFVIAIALSACSVAPGVVKDVYIDNRDPQHPRVHIQKCDIKHWWAYWITISGEANCREEVH